MDSASHHSQFPDPLSPPATAPLAVGLGTVNPHEIEYSNTPPTSIRVLLVEDDFLNRKIVNRMLVKGGFEPVEAHDGAHALALLAQQPIDVVLMDWQMPVMDGLECTRRMRQGQGGEQGRRLPIIALTANAFSEDRVACLAAGMNDFLSKPVLASLLCATVAQWAQQSRVSKLQDSDSPAVEVKPVPPARTPMATDKPPTQTAPALAYDASVLPSLLGTETSNTELERRVIDEFLKSWPVALQAIHAALTHSDAHALRMQMHTLKATSATIGAMEISEITSKQDLRLSAGENVVDALVAILAASFTRFESALARHRTAP